MTTPIQIPDAAVRALEALKKAEMFIENGVEYGFIRLPEKPDPALDTLPKIKAAIATLTASLPHLQLGYEVKDIEEKLLSEMTRRFESPKHLWEGGEILSDNPEYLPIDDTQIGVEFAFNFLRPFLTNEGTKPVDVAAVYREALERISKFDRSHGSWETIAYDAINIAGRALSAEPVQGDDISISDAAKVLLSENNMRAVQDACEGVCKVYRFLDVLDRLSASNLEAEA